jgi:hypothetical protein
MAGPPSSRSPFPSSSGEPSLRRLGVGASSDRPLRAQIVVALVVALALAAVPMYLMRRPNAQQGARAEASAQSSALPLPSAAPVPVAEAKKPPERLKLGPPQRVRCGNGRGNQLEGSACDQLAGIEEALAKAIRESESCAPRVKQHGSLNYVLTVDFVDKKLHVFPGASGDFRGPQARRATECVKRALPKPDWAAMPHQFQRYTIAILATYLPESALRDPNAPPSFE